MPFEIYYFDKKLNILLIKKLSKYRYLKLKMLYKKRLLYHLK